jgi:hypothetical protein
MRDAEGKFPASFIAVSMSIIAALLLVMPSAFAQRCSDRNPQVAVDVLQEVLHSCSSHDAFEAVGYKYGYDVVAKAASVAGERAIPVLQEIAKSPRNSDCSWGRAPEARQALAKLGDEATIRSIRESRNRVNPMMRGNLGELGDDWALTSLVGFLIDHVNDPSMHIQQGPADGPMDLRGVILESIRDIARRHRVLDLPVAADYSPEGILVWKTWLESHKWRTLSDPVYKHVSDPYLRCLARRVEWGYPDAILDIATFGGPAAGLILRDFPRPSPGEPMGARSLFPEIVDQEEGRPRRDREIQGNLQAALGLLGDRQMLGQIAAEINEFPIHFDYIPYEALRKLKFIGGKPAVEILIAALGAHNRMAQVPEQALATCVHDSTPADASDRLRESISKFCEERDFFWEVRRYNGWTMDALARMIKDPPLPSGTAASAENIQTWKVWWVKHKDSAEFIMPVRKSFE